MDALTARDITGLVTRIAGIMTARKDELTRLDSAMGDGDLGLTMEKAFATARDEAGKSEETDAGKLLMKIGMAIARAAPSTMGTLVATGFMAGGKAVGGQTALALPQMVAFFDAFVAGIMQRGKSKPGEKTIVDVIHPAAQALKEAAAAGLGMEEAFRQCAMASAEGLERSKDMIGQHGRVAYYQEQSRGRMDPGAVAGDYIIQGFAAHVAGPGPA
jgi:dihydroxyacetone kinase-like protein